MNLLLAGLGASLGAMLRYAITNYGKRHWEWIDKRFSNLPIPTLFINLTGAFILGLIFGIGTSIFFYALVGTGALGGYTTFSTMNTELVELYKSENYRGLAFYAIFSYLGGVILVFLGFYVGKFL
ncbi:fluoride efflux transporter CrcB [Lactobacillus kefiranofaciens]|uniref:fluoride efflux transporter CrcB n=1 Tax=Lactobacillus kefiranofaciens TaxID=267818 RepID=UPI00246849B1|nr:fluoride efflux transporter CrcB [Lactobacillus kefiranofaciens]MDH5100079.1 fluoride efflux transporter CrcB [Lactobacillus kefiranofaciens]